MSAIFLSHSSSDATVAAEVARHLERAGHRSLFLDFDPDKGIPAGRSWERELYQRLRSCRIVIALLTEAAVASRWVFAEVTQARALGKPVVTLQLDACKVWDVLRGEQILDLRGNRAQGLARLLQDLARHGLDPREDFGWDARRPPYPGLLSFQEADAGIFFGRETAIRDGLAALERLRDLHSEPALVVLGGSGAGKSSLLRAGLVPRLRRDPERWLVLDPFRPGRTPLDELGDVVAAAFARSGAPRDIAAVRTLLERAHGSAPGEARTLLEGLARDLRRAAKTPSARVLVTIDQCEEALGAGDESAGFLALLRRLAGVEGFLLLVALRSDYLSAFQEHPALRGLTFESTVLGPLAPEDVRRVVLGPAELTGLDVEPALAEALVADSVAQDALPLLAFALRELWEARGSEGRLRLETYRHTLGGLAGAVAKRGEEVLAAAKPSPAEETALRKAFMGLARLDVEGRFARRILPHDEVPAAARPLLQRFADARLVVIGERGDEVAHEALLRSWGRLVGWLEEGRRFLGVRERVEVAARVWDEGGRHASLLIPAGKPLDEALQLHTFGVDLSGPQAELLAASVARARRQVRARRIAVGAIAVLAVLALTLFVVAEGRRRDEARALAEVLRLKDSKVARDLVVEVETSWPLDPSREASLEAWQSRAHALVAQRGEHQRALAALRASGGEVRRGDGATGWTFERPEDDWRHDVLAALVADIETLERPGTGLMAVMARRLEFVRTLRQRSLDEHAAAWQEAIQAVRRNAALGPLNLTPQLGLVPLGPDPATGFPEFAHLGSGSVPRRHADGRLMLDENSAIVLVLIPGGTFRMGAQKADAAGANYEVDASDVRGEWPVHEVTLTPFLLGKHEVTQAQWEAMCEGERPSVILAGEVREGQTITRRNPVEQVSWEEADRWLKRHRLVLPTEAQWEYACRAGTSTPWSWGKDVASLGLHGNIADKFRKDQIKHSGTGFTEETDDGWSAHAPVGTYRANAFGLHDLHGNVYEWCADRFGPYDVGPVHDPTGASTGIERVFRGGAWDFAAPFSRSAYRDRNKPTSRNDSIGLRAAHVLEPARP